MGTSKTWPRTLKNLDIFENLDQTLDWILQNFGPCKTWTSQNLNPEKHGFSKTWNKHGIKNYVLLQRVVFYKDHEHCYLLFKC